VEIAGLSLIGIAAAVELVAGGLFIAHKLSPNPHMPFAMFSGVVFAVAGVLLYLGG
jgi:hypothetical protein